MDIALKKNNNQKYLGWGISLGIHALLLLLFFWIKYSLPEVPHYTEDYLEIALGTDEEGFGNEVPEWEDAPAPIHQTKGRVSNHNENHNIETVDNAPDLVKINSKPNPNNTVTTNNNRTNQTTPNRQTQANSDSDQRDNTTQTDNSNRGRTYTGTGNGGNSAQNNTDGTGRGNNPNSQQSLGTVSGNPQGTDIVPRSRLDGRFIEKMPSPKAKYNEKGLVKIKIWVDRNGNVVRHSILSSPSSTLSNIAIEKLNQTKFNKSSTAPDPQTGTIEFNFNVK